VVHHVERGANHPLGAREDLGPGENAEGGVRAEVCVCVCVCVCEKGYGIRDGRRSGGGAKTKSGLG
jgi:hypothetical protein